MFIKYIILIIIGYIIQLNTQNWYNILIFASLIGFGSNSYKQSIYLGISISVFPWLIQFIIQYSSATILLHRISEMFGFNSPFILIFLSILFICILSIIVSISFYHIKIIFNAKK